MIEVIKKHHGAQLSGVHWACMCGYKLPVDLESLHGPKQAEIIDAWAIHLAQRVLYSLKRRGLLVATK